MMSYDEQMAQASSRVKKLPQWAQEYIATLKHRMAQAEAQVAEMLKGPPDSNVFRVWGLRGDDQALGKDAEIRFELPGGGPMANSISVRADRRDGGRFLHIQGDATLYVEGWATNSLRIHLEDLHQGAPKK